MIEGSIRELRQLYEGFREASKRTVLPALVFFAL